MSARLDHQIPCSIDTAFELEPVTTFEPELVTIFELEQVNIGIPLIFVILMDACHHLRVQACHHHRTGACHHLRIRAYHHFQTRTCHNLRTQACHQLSSSCLSPTIELEPVTTYRAQVSHQKRLRIACRNKHLHQPTSTLIDGCRSPVGTTTWTGPPRRPETGADL
jgi:hypothetical protein